MAQVQAQAPAEEQAARRWYEQTVVDRLSAARTPVEQTRHERATLQKLPAMEHVWCAVARYPPPTPNTLRSTTIRTRPTFRLRKLRPWQQPKLPSVNGLALRETIVTVEQEWANLHWQATTVDSLIYRLNQAARRETDREALKLRLATLTEHRSIRPRSGSSGRPTPTEPGT